MNEDDVKTLPPSTPPPRVQDPIPEVLALAIAWSADEPDRVGEVALFEREVSMVLGRGDPGDEGRVRFCRQRPGLEERTGPLTAQGISRHQLRIVWRAAGLEVERIGQTVMRVNGERRERATLACGDTVEISGEMLLLCTRRPREVVKSRWLEDYASGAFGEPDGYGIVGEAPPAWKLRSSLAVAACAGHHAFIHGASGTGKEIAARALHALSDRASKPLVRRHASTLSVEFPALPLFGNVANYPYADLPAQAGLVGRAAGGTLFLDEVCDASPKLQTALLRVLDAGGDYSRVGGSAQLRADVRFIATTNRPLSALMPNFLARFLVRVPVPSLEERREDIPLLARHLVLGEAAMSPKAAGAFVRVIRGREEVVMTPSLVDALVRWPYTTHVAEIRALLRRAMWQSKNGVLDLPPDLRKLAKGPSTDTTLRQLPFASGSVRSRTRAPHGRA